MTESRPQQYGDVGELASVEDRTDDPEENKKKDVLSFVNHHSQEKLASTDARAMELATQYEERKLTIEQRLEKLYEDVIEKTSALNEVLELIDGLNKDLSIRSENTARKIFNLLEIRKLRNKIGIEEERLDELQKEFDAVVSALNETEEEMHDRHELDEIEKMALVFYQEQTQAKEDFERDRAARDVVNVIKKYDVFVTHGFSAEQPELAPVTVLQQGVDWRSKLNILCGLEPHISTSTLRHNNGDDQPFFKMGVLIGGGSISGAHSQDSSTVVSGQDRRPLNGFVGIEANDMETEISQAVSGVAPQSHNEISMERPKINGLFFCEDLFNNSWNYKGRRKGIDDYYGSDPETLLATIFEEAERRSMPVYMRADDGKMYEAIYNPHADTSVILSYQKVSDFRRRLTRGREITPEDILTNGFEISDDQKKQSREAIFEDCPFKLDIQERKAFDVWQIAQESYARLKNQDQGHEKPWLVPRYNQDKDETFLTIDQGYSLKGKISSVVDCIQAVEKDLTERQIKIDSMKQKLSQGEEKDQSMLMSSAEANRRGVVWPVENRYEVLIKTEQFFQDHHKFVFGYFLHGLAKTAEASGDIDTSRLASALAEQCVKKDECQEMLSRRLGENGKFKITEVDLKHVGTGPV